MTIDSFSGRYAFLSNFYPVPGGVEDEGIEYPTSENAFQAAKTLDMQYRKSIAYSSPTQAKRLGHAIALRPQWNQVKVSVMKRIVRTKFSEPTLREKLLATGDEELVEGNDWHDTYWGVCNGVGQNMLGKILMEVRAELREEVSTVVPHP